MISQEYEVITTGFIRLHRSLFYKSSFLDPLPITNFYKHFLEERLNRDVRLLVNNLITNFIVFVSFFSYIVAVRYYNFHVLRDKTLLVGSNNGDNSVRGLLSTFNLN